MKQPLIFDSIEAIHTGGSYMVGADGKATRRDAESGPLPNAEGAPGPAAELNAAAVGVAPAHPEASASSGAPPATTSAKTSGKAAA